MEMIFFRRRKLLEKLRKIRVAMFDVDGVLTDGCIIFTNQGDELKNFYVRDGYGLVEVARKGIELVVMTGRSSALVERRAQDIGFHHIFQGVLDKKKKFEEFCKTNSVAPDEVLFMGDDIPDLAVMKEVGVAVCPENAVREVKKIATFVTQHAGGHGAVREVTDLLLEAKGFSR
jgi:3-deoxy-D-manno-octulosonate 8-phosphate phosphatase (KDO 8-P phosphatase)